MHSHPYHSRSISSQKITTVWHTKEITLVGFTLFFTGELGTGYIFINDLLNKTREIFNVCISLYIYRKLRMYYGTNEYSCDFNIDIQVKLLP